ANPVRLSYHLYGPNGLVTWDGLRTALPYDIGANGSVDLDASVQALAPGTYTIFWDLAHENVTWFSAQLNPMMEMNVTIPNSGPYAVTVSPAGAVTSKAPPLKVTAHNPDGWPPGEPLQYLFRVCTNEAMDQGCQGSPWQTADTWSPTLRWGGEYFWQTDIREGDGTGGRITTPADWKVALSPVVAQPPVERHFGADPFGSNYGGVNPSVGNYTGQFTDAVVPGVGPALSVVRTYNSMDTRVGIFGKGWSSAFDTRLAEEDAGAFVLVAYGDGRRERYGRNADGTYAAGGSLDTALSGSATTGWTLTKSGGEQLLFNGSGQLTAMVDAQAHRLDLTYTSGKLSQVRNPINGRFLTLTWTTTGTPKVKTIKTNQSTPDTTWTYGYSGDLLTSVCDPEGRVPEPDKCTVYGYASGGVADGRLESITLPEGDLHAKFGYGPDGTVAWREDGAGMRWTFAHDRAKLEGLYYPVVGGRAADLTIGANGGSATIDPTGVGGVPATGVQAVVVNVSVANPGASGWVGTWLAGQSEPVVSVMDFVAGEYLTKTVTVPVGADGNFTVGNHSTTANRYVFDVVGWYSQANGPAGGAAYKPVAGTRLLDSRSGTGGYSTPWTDGTTRDLTVTGVGGVP
ncbi:MAG: DUF6531 domain-containing protein, partial [Acidimicrobiales bacterium]